MIRYRACFPFNGLGAGALGFLEAEVELLGQEIRFESIGGVDMDAEACVDFERLTGTPALCADVRALTAADLRRAFGEDAPDVVFLSPPCTGASGLLSAAKAATAHYRKLNGLALAWIRTMLKAWTPPPRLVLLENVPRLKTRAKRMLEQTKRLLRGAGYVIHEGFHCCGEIGGLAQRRRRYLLVARHQPQVDELLYKPPRKRVRACGEVLGDLPLPHDPSGGPLHRLPKLSWRNWVRLALIPAGGDWRDLEGVLAEGQARREQWGRHGVAAWDAPTGTVAGSGSNGVNALADPRAFALPSDNPDRHWHKYAVGSWDEPSRAVIGATRPGSGGPAIADPRTVEWFRGTYGVLDWDESANCVTGRSAPSTGRFSVADPRVRVRHAYDAGYAVLSWEQAARTIAGTTAVGCGAYAVADPRVAQLGVRPVTEQEIEAVSARPDRPPPFIPLILAADGTWHRPLTTLELAALQGLPTRLDGRPLKLAGSAISRWRQRIGNAVPVGTARAIAEQMLLTLAHADGALLLSPRGPIWVRPPERRLDA